MLTYFDALAEPSPQIPVAIYQVCIFRRRRTRELVVISYLSYTVPNFPRRWSKRRHSLRWSRKLLSLLDRRVSRGTSEHTQGLAVQAVLDHSGRHNLLFPDRLQLASRPRVHYIPRTDKDVVAVFRSAPLVRFAPFAPATSGHGSDINPATLCLFTEFLLYMVAETSRTLECCSFETACLNGVLGTFH